MSAGPTSRQRAAVRVGVAIHLARFAVILGALELASLLGIQGWYQGLFVNVWCCVFAAGLITWWGLWREIGMLTPWAGPAATLLALVLAGESVIRVAAVGLADKSPGFALWALSLLLVGVNEELTSRGAVLTRLRADFTATPAVVITGLLFGLQHLSLFATTGRGAGDILTNVLASTCYGVALAGFQYRFRWIWPLILIHAAADCTTVLAGHDIGFVFDLVTSIVFVVYGLAVVRGRSGYRSARS